MDSASPLVPSSRLMLAHVGHLFGDDLGALQHGLVELAWNSPGERAVKHGQLYPINRLALLVEHAETKNRQGSNVYIGAALRQPGTNPYARAKDADFLALTAAYVDLDKPGTVKAAKSTYLDFKPTAVVLTGNIPHPRAQLWWKLKSPISDPEQSQALLKAMARGLDGDPTVSNPSRVMRLAGSIAWPVKPDRVQEATDLLYPPGAASGYGATALGAHFGSAQEAPRPASPTHPRGEDAGGDAIERQPDTFGMPTGKVVNGREKHALDTLLACLIQLIGEKGGNTPSAEELHALAWPQFRDGTELSRPRAATKQPWTEEALLERAAYTLQRFAAGDIATCRTTEEALTRYAVKQSVKRPGGPPNTGFSGPPIAAGTPIVLTDAQFMAGFRPPDYTVDWVIQKSYLYALTARTGHGKTAVAMLMMTSIVRGMPFHGKGTELGGVLYFAGENSNDIRARYQLYADTLQFEIGKVPAYFIDGVLDINVNIKRISEEAAKIPNLSLIIIDTKQAYFTGDEGNSNEQQMAFARMARRLISELPSHPAVIILCHPVKNAGQDNLTPMGGSAFLNEIDANLTLWAEDKVCTLTPHQDKWRGVSFEALAFDLRVATSDAMKDTKGRHIPSVIAEPITEQVAERRGVVAEEDDKTALRLINLHKGNISISGIAQAAGWLNPNGGVAKSKAQRVIERLKVSKFIYRFHGSKYRLTKKGAKLIGVKFESGEDADE